MAKLFSVSVCPAASPVDPVRVESHLTTVGEWIRFNPWQWFLYSERSKVEIVEAARRGLQPNDHVLVTAIKAEVAAGWTAPWIWSWLNDKMNKIIMSG